MLSRNTIRNIVAGAVMLFMLSSTGCEVTPIEVSEIEFFIAKDWKISAVYKDGELQTVSDMQNGDHLEDYRLTLHDDFTFDRTYFDGSNSSGNWQLTSGLTQLILFAGEPDEEHWLILDLKVRRLEMRLLQDPTKPQLDIRYVLEPVK